MTQQLQALTVAKLDDMAPLGINKACVVWKGIGLIIQIRIMPYA